MMGVQFDDEAPWGDCNKCGTAGDVNPDSGVCEYCGCADPEAEYPDAVWLVGQNPFSRQYQHTPDTCPICVGKPLPPLRIGRHTCNICGNTSPAVEG